MGGKKKKIQKSQTPRRKSTRKRERTIKGQYYDEHFGEFSAETHVTGSLDVTPPICPDLDTTRAIEQLIANDTGGCDDVPGGNLHDLSLTAANTDNLEEIPALDKDTLLYLSNVYDRYEELETVGPDAAEVLLHQFCHTYTAEVQLDVAEEAEAAINDFSRNVVVSSDINYLVAVEEESERVTEVIDDITQIHYHTQATLQLTSTTDLFIHDLPFIWTHNYNNISLAI